MKNLLLLSILSLFIGCTAPVKNNKLEVYAVCLNKFDETTIERLFKTEKDAVSYIEEFKESHEYFLEVLEVK